MIPELKTPEVPMPFQGEYERTDYADQFIDAYRRAGVEPTDVRPQSFDLADIAYWLDAYPEYGRQAIYLDGRVIREDFDADHPERLEPTMPELVAMGVRTIAPPIWVLVTVADGRIVPSAYARAAKAAGLDIVTWTLERPGTVSGIGGFYFHTVATEVDNEGDVYTVLDVLAREVGVIGVFSDWPATVTYYANCIGL
jgi:glycerophosphoryl diester phosphodiesterase